MQRLYITSCYRAEQLYNTVCSFPSHFKLPLETFRTVHSQTNTTMTMAEKKSFPKQKFDYFLVLDFEATCDDTRRLVPQEIIEFPCLKVNAKNLKIESQFHQYVQPQVHKELTPFCTELTGIIQDMIDGKPHLEETLKNFDQWLKDEGLLDEGVSSIFVTCGDWDLKTMLPSQCRYFNIKPNKIFSKWINIKKSFADFTGVFPKGMMFMLSKLHIPHQGRYHSGIDDSKNIANILTTMIQKGYVFKQTLPFQRL